MLCTRMRKTFSWTANYHMWCDVDVNVCGGSPLSDINSLSRRTLVGADADVALGQSSILCVRGVEN